MASEMVKLEEAALAIAAVMERRRHGKSTMPWEFSPEREEALEYARAAIEAMRAPTEGMVKAGFDCLMGDVQPEPWPKAPDGSEYVSEYVQTAQAYTAMIDSALEG